METITNGARPAVELAAAAWINKPADTKEAAVH
jgi:hypothetical protein